MPRIEVDVPDQTHQALLELTADSSGPAALLSILAQIVAERIQICEGRAVIPYADGGEIRYSSDPDELLACFATRILPLADAGAQQLGSPSRETGVPEEFHRLLDEIYCEPRNQLDRSVIQLLEDARQMRTRYGHKVGI